MSAVERLAAAMHARWHGTPYEASMVFSEEAHRILAADPALASAIELGLAWQEAEAALPEGALIEVGQRPEHVGGWFVNCMVKIGDSRWEGFNPYVTGDTPAAALRALAEKLR